MATFAAITEHEYVKDRHLAPPCRKRSLVIEQCCATTKTVQCTRKYGLSTGTKSATLNDAERRNDRRRALSLQ